MHRDTSDYRFSTHGMVPTPAEPGADGKIQTYKGAYISITNACNTDVCGYCYARAEQKKPPMTRAAFRQAIHWLHEISDFPEVYFVGGEPSTHPELIGFLDDLADLGWGATLYTNGAFGAEQCTALAAHPALKRVAFHYEDVFFERFPSYRGRLLHNMEVLSPSKECSLLFVITRSDFSYLEPLRYAQAYDLALTWIFAAPTSGQTPYLGLHTMRAAGPQLQEFLLRCAELGIRTSPDLPVPLCVFEPEFLERYRDEFKLVRRCRPFIYLKADLSTQFCTAMPVHSSPPIDSSVRMLHVIQDYRRADSALKQKHSFPECVDCQHHLAGTCQGGCMTYKAYANAGMAQ